MSALARESPKIEAILEEWEAARERGENRTPEELCANTPNLLETIRKKLAALEAFDSLHSHLDRSTALHVEAEAETRRPPTVPGYELFDELGRGGMGVVYRSRQLALNRVVALKMILAGGFAGPETRERFHREAEAIARLQHPNIVQVYEFGSVDGQPYAALEYVGSGTLAQRLNRRPISPDDAAGLIEVLARAVHHAHEHGVVHRDLKPGNVLLTDETTFKAPKISDFGLAKLLDGTGGNQTKSGDVFGTPGYMAPEQARGDSASIGPGCDVYALGAILYECLTGRPPFEGTNIIEILTQIGATEPVAPRSLLPTTPRDIETICLKCLEKEPASRYDSAAALAKDLARFRRGEPVLARPIGRLGRLVRWAKRNPTVATLTTLAVAGLVATVMVSSVFAVQSARSAEKLRGALDESEVRLAESHASRGRALCESGDIDLGLLWYARALQILPPGHPELEAEFREEFGGWEQNQRPLQAILTHDDRPFVLLVRPDIERLLIASTKSARLWDLATYKQVGDGLSHGIDISDAKFSPDGTTIAIGGERDDGATISLWNAKTGKSSGALINPETVQVEALDWSPNGEYLAAGVLDPIGGERRLVAWHLPTKLALGTTVAIDGDFAAIQFPSNSERVYAFQNLDNGFAGGRIVELNLKTDRQVGTPIRIPPRGTTMSVPHSMTLVDGGKSAWTISWYRARKWDLATGTLVDSFPLTQPVPAVAFPPTGTAAWIAEGGTARQYSITTGSSTTGKLRHGATITAIAVDPQGIVATAAEDRTTRVWGALPAQTTSHGQGPVRRVTISPDARYALSANDGGITYLWNLTTQPPSTRRLHHENALFSAAFSPDGTRVVGVAGSGGKVLYQWNTAEGREVVPPVELSGYVSLVGFSKVGSQFVTGAGAWIHDHGKSVPIGRLQLWDSQTGQPIGQPLETEPGYVISAGFAATGTRVFVVFRTIRGTDLRIAEWETATSQSTGPSAPTRFSSRTLTSRIAIHPDGHWIAAPATESGVILWDRDTKTERLLTGAFADPVTVLSVSPDGSLLFTGSADGWFGVYEVSTGHVVARSRGHVREVKAGLFPLGENRLITASEDGTVRQWDLRTGSARGAPYLHPDGTFAAAITPDGSYLLTGCQDGNARLWTRKFIVPGSPREIQKRAEKRTGFTLETDGSPRVLSEAEWRER